jgi:long-subunit fatty acid transport protein
MKTNFIVTILLLLVFIVPSQMVLAQFPEDILRLSFPGIGVGARSLGLGMAYTGVANDFSAAYANPAGLGQLHMNEVSFGLSNLSYGNTSSFFGSSESFTNSGTSVNSLGLVYSVPSARGSFVVAIGYGRDADFTTGLSFNGFNPRSSIVQTWAPDGQSYANNDPSSNLAYQLYLANIDTISGKYVSKIRDSVTQSGKVIEGGGLNHISLSGAFEAAPGLFLGATLNIITGSYSYTRNYYEDDLKSIYQTSPFDFTSLSLLETVESDISGFSAKLGFLYDFTPNGRVGITVKTPSWITVRETFSQSATSDFDNGDHFAYTVVDGERNEYDVSTPFVFSAGLSYHIQRLLLTGDIEYTDWTQMEFRNATASLLAYNTQIKGEFRSTANLKVGAEYEVLEGQMQLRGGFAYLPSPYDGDPSDFARKYITAGIGFLVQNAIAIDIAYAHGAWKNYRVNYNSSSRVDEDVTTQNLIGTVSYRF